MPIDKSTLTAFDEVSPLSVRKYEQMLPYETNQNVVEKLNDVIESLARIGMLNNLVVSQWNMVMKWIRDYALEEVTERVTNEKLDLALDNGLKVLTETITSEKIVDLVATGEFENIVTDSINAIHTEVATEINVVNERINNIMELPADSSINNARLEDITVGADGTNYASPGDAVRLQIGKVKTDTDAFKNSISVLVKPKNLLNVADPNFIDGKYMNPSTGALTDNATYKTTGFIDVTAGKKITRTVKAISSGQRAKTSMRFITAFNGSTLQPTMGSSVDTTDYTVPTGVTKIRISYIEQTNTSDNMIYETEISDNVVPAYEAYFVPYRKPNTETDKTLLKENVPADAKTVGDTISALKQSVSAHKNPTAIKKSASLTANAVLSIPEFPQMLKNGQRFAYSAKLATLSASDVIKVGFINSAYTVYQGWLEVTNTQVKWMRSGTTDIIAQNHGLTIADFVNVVVNIRADNARLEIVLSTVNGTFKFNQSSDSTRYLNTGSLTAQASVATSNVVLSGTCTQFDCDTWMIVDSYGGDGADRVGGRLNEWGYAKGILMSGVGGLNSQNGLDELKRLLTYGTPKTLIWYLGMNDDATTVSTYFTQVEQLCKTNGISLVFNRIPFVPSRLTQNKAVHDFVMVNNRRYVDSYSAIGSDANGNWYTGHLNVDGVHPDPLGASALTSKLITDVPEILTGSFA